MRTVTLYRPNTLRDLVERQGLRSSVLNNLDRYIESFFGDSALTPATKVFNHTPAVDIRETEKAYMLEMELPGCNENDIEIHVDGNTLSIASKKEEVKENKDTVNDQEKDQSANGSGETWLLRERRISSFSRSFKLPEDVNPEEVSAEFKNGVLSMEFKKRPEAQKRTIQINIK